MAGILAWIAARPCASHALVSGAETVVLALIGRAAGLPHAPVVAALVVSTFYYGREAGQREHDLKHGIPAASPLMAFLGAEYGFRWGLDNLLQWLAAAGATSAVAAALTFAGL